MTYDDGILKIYQIENSAKKGDKPVYVLKRKSTHYYGFDTLGYNRYYTALQVNQQIEAVVNLPGWNDISVKDICALDGGQQYKIATVQTMINEDGLRFTKLSLERIGEVYAVGS